MNIESKLPEEQTKYPLPPARLTGRILVVEDDPSVQKILKRWFEAERFAVEGHMDGRAALDSFHADLPSAVILDLHLPKLPGQLLLREMKSAAPSVGGYSHRFLRCD